MSDDELQDVTTTITAIHANRTSKSGTPYCAIEVDAEPGEWFFLWDGDFKDDIEAHPELYEGAKVRLLYTDKEDDPDDHFFNVKMVWPTSQETCRTLLDLKQQTAEA